MTTPIYRTLIDATTLRTLYAPGADLVLLDCGYDLADAEAGRRAHAAGHLPGARYVHLDHDLSGAPSGHNGRHPLPERGTLAARAGAWGIAPDTQVVAYDAQGGPFAARAWWMLRWLGHDAVAVLDGGRGAWLAEGGELTRDSALPPARPPYPQRPTAMRVIDASSLLGALSRVTLIDARSADRFRGENETLDPVAGHIPGALNRFFKDNLGQDGRFKTVSELRAAYTALGPDAAAVVHQCGSGVTACHNLLAMEHAGLPGSTLYPGSWSEWCADPARPVARG